MTTRNKSGAAPEQPFSYLTRGPTGMSGVIIEQLNSDDHIRCVRKSTLFHVGVVYQNYAPEMKLYCF